MNSPEETNTGPVIRDRRRIDPVTGQVKDPGRPQSREAGAGGAARPRPGRHAASRPGGPSGGGASGGAGSGSRPRNGAAAAGPGAAASGPGAPGEAGPLPGSGEPQSGAGGRSADPAQALAERTADLQRVTAEYANYRKRVERDRLAVREQALANVLAALLPVLDDIGRAREHEELTGGFKSVAESLEATTSKLGLQSFGETGEPFDPNVHDALMHSYSASVSEPTCVQILQPGYKVGERVLRPARVAVAEPGDGSPDDEAGSDGGDGAAARPGPPGNATGTDQRQ